jgi:ABC-type transport system involved in cytochrome bd biosynthesis fused ATPase/permease subunit
LIPIFMILIGWTTEKLTGRRWRVQARLAHHFADLISGLPTLRAFGRARAQIEGLRRSGEANRAETMATLRIALLSALVLELLATLSVAIVAVVIGLRVIGGSVDLPTALFVLVLAPEAYLPLRKVGVHYHEAADGVAAVRTAFDLIERSQDRPAFVGTAPAGGPPEVRFSGVAVELGGRRLPVEEGVDLVAPAGGVTVLTGPSGAGKSSLLNVIMGWLPVVQGQVLIGGTDLAAMDARHLRRMIAWVGQEPQLLRGTVADNVRLGHPDATDAEVAEALRAAGAALTPDRLVGEESSLSAGERRRVALARAWVRVRSGGARLMILDEPTAGLDERTELAALQAVAGLDATVIMVSHRPAVLAAADHVVRIGGGR